MRRRRTRGLGFTLTIKPSHLNRRRKRSHIRGWPIDRYGIGSLANEDFPFRQRPAVFNIPIWNLLSTVGVICGSRESERPIRRRARYGYNRTLRRNCLGNGFTCCERSASEL